jgi:hypothetical protein
MGSKVNITETDVNVPDILEIYTRNQEGMGLPKMNIQLTVLRY